MNKSEFLKKLEFETNNFEINFDFLTDWYSKINDELSLAFQKSKLNTNPSHKGLLLEDILSEIIKQIIPNRFSLNKGYAININSFKSREQDIIIFNNALGNALVQNEIIKYIPIEIITSTIEVKSTMNILELRKSLLNVVSAKKLYYEGEFKDQFKAPLSSIFAYDCTFSESNFLKKLNEEIINIPPLYRPNFMYIHNMGLILPKRKDENGIPANLEDIIKYNGDDNEYGIIPIKTENGIGKQLLFLFIKFQIEHAQNLYKTQTKIDYFNYINKGILWKNKLLKENSGKKLPKYYHKETIKIFDGNHAIKALTGKCTNCNKENFFVKVDFAHSEKFINNVIEKNIAFQKLSSDNKCYNCLEKIEPHE